MPKVRPAIGNLMTMSQWSHPDFAMIGLPHFAEPAGRRPVAVPNSMR
jgi:hypothetical protein